MNLWRIATVFGTLLIVVDLIGCGGPQYRTPATVLNGRVTADGKPISNGIVTAYQNGSKVMEAAIEVDGTYVFADPPSGQYQFTVTGNNVASHVGKPLKLPAKYAIPGASGLTATVASDQVNTQDLQLRTK